MTELINHPDRIKDIINEFAKTHNAMIYMCRTPLGDIEFKLRNDAWSTATHVPYEKVTEERIIETLNILYEELQRKENQQT